MKRIINLNINTIEIKRNMVEINGDAVEIIRNN